MDLLIIGARQFDQNALAEIYDKYSTHLYRYAMHILGDPYLAEECVAATFSKFLAALKTGGGPKDHLQAYLYRIAHNWITDQFRRQPPQTIALFDDLADDSLDQEAVIDQKMEHEKIRLALRCLTKDQLQVVILKYLEGFGNEDIAGALGKPVGAVKSLQHRAMESLRRMMSHQEYMK